MFNLLSIKDGIYLAVISALIGSAWYILQDWHYKPLKDNVKIITSQKIIIKTQEITINNLGVEIVQLVEQNKVVGFESYFTGLADANNSTDNNNLIF